MTLKQLKYALMLATEIVVEATAVNHESFKTIVEAIDFRNSFALRKPTQISLMVRN